MAQSIGGKKSLILCILRIFEEYSDCDHPLTHQAIIQLLEKDYAITAARNAVSSHISLLKELGYDIVSSAKGSYLQERLFDDMELRVLMDSVLSSRYIPEINAKQLIHKLGQLSSTHFRKTVPHVRMVNEWNHQHNKEFFWNLAALSEAIDQNKQVSFTYNRPKADGRLHPLRDNADIVHPFALMCTNGQYYLLASHSQYDDLRHFRVDRITDIQVSDEPRRSICSIPGWDKGLDIARYIREHNLMYGGQAEKIVLKVDGAYAGIILDAFGSAASMEEQMDGNILVTIFTAASSMRFWALQFSNVCEVLEPVSLRETIQADIKKLCIKYQV